MSGTRVQLSVCKTWIEFVSGVEGDFRRMVGEHVKTCPLCQGFRAACRGLAAELKTPRPEELEGPGIYLLPE
jgi:hypothetical protein